jgi:acyl-coenzyme A synthetase/AMP-(fatty) acid ligase/3-hydroxymyristoyl/3-hydroxydecanoyl-(acyl carrier protein) dehydratase
VKLLPLSLRFAAEGNDERVVATTRERAVTFADFRSDVACNAARLRAIGCRRGLLATTDGYGMAVGLFALLHAKAVAVLPSNPLATDRQAFNADVVLSDEFLQPADRRSGPVDVLDPAGSRIEIFTSGSTGQPKLVAKTLLEMETEAAAIENALGHAASGATVFGTVPHHHLYGLTFRLFWPLSTGRRLMTQTYAFWESLAADLVPQAVLVTSPAHLMRIPPLPALREAKLAMVLSAGAPLPSESAAAAAAALGCPVTDIFGSTETGSIAHRASGSPWRPFPGVAIRRLEDGRLSVRSDHLGGDAWHETADLVSPLPEGSFELLGRADRIVKIEGNRISLTDLEARLAASPLVEQAAVVALETDPVSLGAAVVLTAEGRAQLQQIGAFRLGRSLRRGLAEALAPGGLPRHWRFVPSLPVANLGKRRNADLAALFAPAQDAPHEPVLRSELRTEDKVTLELFIPAELQCLQGHFPGLPVVPGVAQLDWAVKLAARVFELPIAAAERFQIKFKRVATAPSVITLTLRHLSSQGQIAFEYAQGDSVISQGSFAVADVR